MKLVIASFVVVLVGLIGGCAADAKKPAANASVLDVKPVQHAPKPAVATNVAADPLPSDSIVYPRATPVAAPTAPVMLTSSTPEPAVSGAVAVGKYKVKPGDTLYGIARTTYGDGKQWTKITSANPGLNAKSLKAGQLITLP